MEAFRAGPRGFTSWGLVAMLAVAVGLYAASYPINHDLGWWLYIAKSMMAGQDLYGSLVEVNPPLNAYLSMIPAVIASSTGLPLSVVVQAWIFSIALLALTIAVRLLARADAGQHQFLGPVLAAGLLLAFFGAPGIDLGQREHLMVLLTVPYLVLLWRRMMGDVIVFRTATSVGLLAGLGYSLKPHFALIWLALELSYQLELRRRRAGSVIRPEAVTVLCVGLVYMALTLAMYPEYFALLWDSSDIYSRFADEGRVDLMTNGYLLILLVGLALVWKKRTVVSRLARVFVIAAGFAFGVAVLQGKGWSYHYYPVLAWATVAGVLLLYDFRPHRRPSVNPATVGIGVTVALLAFSILVVFSDAVRAHMSERDRRVSETREIVTYFRDVQDGAAVLILSDLVSDAFPLVTETGLKWGSPFPSLWWIRAVYESETESSLRIRRPTEMDPMERVFVGQLIRSFVERQPQRVLIDTASKSYYGRSVFPYIEYLSQSPIFRREWSAFERHGSVGRFAAWRRSAVRAASHQGAP